jgi:ankyrin repeat protein
VHHASTRGPEFTLLVEALVAAGADPFAKGPPPHGRSMLTDVCIPRYKFYTSDACIAILDLHALSPHVAAARREDAIDANGRTPLDLARSAGAKDVEAALLKEPWARLWADGV